MPMRSKSQRAYLHIHHPEIAAEFEAATPKGVKLPEHVEKKAYFQGNDEALTQYGVKTAGLPGMLGRGMNLLGKGLNWGGKALGTVTGPVGGGISALGGAIQGFSNGEGLKGALARGATNFVTGSIPGGAGLVAGAAGDAAMNHMLAPKPALGVQ